MKGKRLLYACVLESKSGNWMQKEAHQDRRAPGNALDADHGPGELRFPVACKREILAHILARVLEPFKKGEIVRRGARDKQVSGLKKARFRAVV